MKKEIKVKCDLRIWNRKLMKIIFLYKNICMVADSQMPWNSVYKSYSFS